MKSLILSICFFFLTFSLYCFDIILSGFMDNRIPITFYLEKTENELRGTYAYRDNHERIRNSLKRVPLGFKTYLKRVDPPGCILSGIVLKVHKTAHCWKPVLERPLSTESFEKTLLE